MSHPMPDRIPEERVAMILERAADIDRNARESVQLDALRSAAIEAGISEAAVDAALAEYAAGQIEAGKAEPATDAGARPKRWSVRGILRRLGRPVLAGAAALMASMLLADMGAGAEPLIVLAWLVWVGLAVRRVRRDRPTARIAGFLLNGVLSSAGFMLGFGVAGYGDEVAVFAFTGVAMLAIGTLLIKLRLRETKAVLTPHA